MDANERAVYYYLKARRPKAATSREISRHVGSRRRFRYDPEWIRAVLSRLEERGIVEPDADGAYRIKPMPKQETQGKRWTSTHIAEILKASGKVFSGVITVEDEDEYYTAR
jgi:predicted transcriptional regulator of viral defense system